MTTVPKRVEVTPRPTSQARASAARFPNWKGFEVAPRGQLLRQVVDLDAPMGIAYERSIGFHKDFHTHDRHMLVAPRGACRMEVRTERLRETFVVDARSVLVVPKDVVHDDTAVSVVYDTLALYPSDTRIEEMGSENGFTSGELERLGKACVKLVRSPWLDDLIGRYFLERVLGHQAAVGSGYYLEKQILNEVARLLIPRARAENPSDDSDHRGDCLDLFERAVTFVEGNLFEALDLAAICHAVRASESSVLRAFRGALGVTPKQYIKNRRLDEAASLLRGADLRVSDVALLIGYEDLSAFGKAFRARFRCSPADYRRVTD